CSLISEAAAVSNSGNHETMLDRRQARFIESQPCNRSDSARNKQEPIRILPSYLAQPLRDRNSKRNSRKVIVAKGRVANVTRKKHLIRSFARNEIFAVGQVSFPKRSVNEDFILFIRHRRKLFLR